MFSSEFAQLSVKTEDLGSSWFHNGLWRLGAPVVMLGMLITDDEGKICWVDHEQGWATPTHRLPFGQDLTQTAINRTREKLGLEIRIDEICPTELHPFGIIKYSTRVPVIHAKMIGGEPKPLEKDIFDVRFLTQREIMNWNGPMRSPSQKDFVLRHIPHLT